jgi:hypothetical protein
MQESEQRLRSLSVLIPLETVQASLEQIGFQLEDTATIVAEGKFWKKLLYSKSDETISVSEELGDSYPKDPIITICGTPYTIEHVVKDVGG